MNKKLWMLFRTEHCVYYFWNGDYPALVSLPPGSNPEAYYWMGQPPRDMPQVEIDILNEFAASTKRVMKFPARKGIRYIVMERGKFLQE